MKKNTCPLLLKWCLSVLAVMAFGFPGDAWAQTQRCPKPQAHAEHWYLPIEHNAADHAPLQCASCAAPENRAHRSCIVYRILQSADCSDGYCANEQGEIKFYSELGYALQRSLRFERPSKFMFDAGSNCWFILWATEPVIGSEQAGAREQTNYWQMGLDAARTRVDPAIPNAQVALLIHAANRRSQHQLHLHIGRLMPAYRSALDSVDVAQEVSGQTITLQIGEATILARFVADMPGKPALYGVPVFDLAQDMLPSGAADMPLYTLMLVRSTRSAGSWILASKQLTRRMLSFSEASSCRLVNE